MKAFIIISAALMAFVCCTPQPQPISYGNDGCAFCKMTIVDSRYSAELVSDKGKVFKFDAIECMVNYEKQNSETIFALKLISSFDKKELISAAQSHYLRSEKLPSPMGMYITGFSDKATAKSFAENHGGALYTWESLHENFDALPEIKPLTLN